MSADVLSPLVIPTPSRWPGQPTASTGAARRLSMSELPTIREAGTLYGFASVDGRGRVSDKAMPRALDWIPGTRLDIRATLGLLVVRACLEGVFTITGQGYLALPASVRRWCDLAAGERVFLAGVPSEGQLLVYPPAALDALISTSRSQLPAGGAL